MAKGPLPSDPDGRTVSHKNDEQLGSMECLEKETTNRGKDVPVSPDRSGSSIITRQVSHDGFVPIEEEGKASTVDRFRGSPVRCVSEFDRVTSQGAFAKKLHDICTTSTSPPPMPNPLRNRRFLSHHVHSLRLEAELLPLRLILSRLMAHPTYNKKGLFNAPVDPVALKLPDYCTIIETPMDLGTVKTRLHSFEYKSRDDATSDIRLCFTNAMTYNHPQNYVHSVAKELLQFFEDQMVQFYPEAMASSPNIDAAASTASPVTSQTQPTRFEASPLVHIHSSSRNETLPKKGRSGIRHNCQWCLGNVCSICLQGCLHMEPTLLVCTGPQCASKRIRKNNVYYTSSDGTFQYCQRCHSGLPSVLPVRSPGEMSCRYKRDLLKRRNDEEIVERWVSCSVCHAPNHQICAMFNPHVHDEDSYVCPSCSAIDPEESNTDVASTMPYSFVTGAKMPVPVSQLGDSACVDGECVLGADALAKNNLSSFIEEKVRNVLSSSSCPSAAETITVRVVSDCDKTFAVPEIIQRHFELADSEGSRVAPPNTVPYKSKAIILFQKIDGVDVAIFSMYVHEYEDVNCYGVDQEKRVYIAYLDSVDYFRPRTHRTQVYHEIITAYLATARKRNFTAAHIWACPPSRGNSFVFWNHPQSQRTPNIERLTAWYHSALTHAAKCGVVTDVMSQYESDFEPTVRRLSLFECSDIVDRMPCPPLIDGDFWIEEALRVHTIMVARQTKDLLVDLKTPTQLSEQQRLCPALVTGAMIRDKIIALPASLAFRRPVNAAAMNLKNYHSIVQTPMDFSTVHTKCLLGEYITLRDLVDDVELIFSNAMKFNPPQNLVHINAVDLRAKFFLELDGLTSTWYRVPRTSEQHSWTQFEATKFDLGASLATSPTACAKENTKPKDHECPNASLTDLTSGPHAIEERMIGGDADQRLAQQKGPPKKTKRKKNACEEPPPKRRRQTWLGEEVANTVRRMRTSIFKCSLGHRRNAQNTQIFSNKNFEQYVASFNCSSDVGPTGVVADSRQGLLEFSQHRHLEFDTLRRAKYSSSVLLYHLHHHDAPGLVPSCTSCHTQISMVRWHRIGKVSEIRGNVASVQAQGPSQLSPTELCSSCFNTQPSHRDDFIPVPVYSYDQ